MIFNDDKNVNAYILNLGAKVVFFGYK